MSEHQEFLEMCALYTSGSLSDEQLRMLHDHLEDCLDCGRAFKEFGEIESMGMAALSLELARESFAGDGKPLTERTARKLLARIEDKIHARRLGSEANATADVLRNIPIIVANPNWVQGEPGLSSRAPFTVKRLAKIALGFSRTLLPYAAALLLAAIISIYSYRVGARRISDVSAGMMKEVETRADSLKTRIAELSRDRDATNGRLEESAKNIRSLTEKINLQMNEMASLEDQKKQLVERAQGADAQRLASESEREMLNRKLAEAQVSLAAMQRNLELARQLQSTDSLRATNLEGRVDDLTAAIKDQDQTIRQQRDLLAYDRDIRDLIGARDLYVAEVTDVGRDAETKTPFGRVFFTKGKSLIFYAYDLDKQPGVQRTSVFRAWGRRGPDFEQALPLGILYVDSSSKRRWVLRFDDPKALAKIDAVFVTVERNNRGGKPSGKPLLFAYLRVEPNHP